MLAGIIGVNHAGENRATIMTNLNNHNNAIVEAASITILQAVILRNVAQAFGINSNGSKTDIAVRILAAGQTANDQETPLDQPRDIKFIELDDLESTTQFDTWMDDIKTKLEARNPGPNNVWTILDTQLNGSPAQINALRISPRSAQVLLLAFAGLKTSLSAEIRKQFQSLRFTHAWEVIRWVTQKQTELGSARHRKAKADLNRKHWKDSNSSLRTWVGVLRSMAAECGPEIPVGRCREEHIRQLIFKNVQENNPDCAFVIRKHKLQDVVDPGFGVDDLVIELTKVIVESESKPERQCVAFAATVQSESELKSAVTTLIAEKTKAEDTAKTALADKKRADEQLSFYSNFGDGRPKGGQPFRKPKGSGKHRPSAASSGSTGKFCHKCCKFYTERNQRDAKDYVIRSHNTKDCHFNKPNSQNSGGDTFRPRNTRKQDAKSKKGGGKQSGKKGRH